jgi:subfamily B ATP-binding cassette protein MsbA
MAQKRTEVNNFKALYGIWARLFRHLRTSPSTIIFVISTTVLPGISSSINLFALRYTLDNLSSTRSRSAFLMAFAIFLLSILLRGVGQFVNSRKLYLIRSKLETDIKNELFRKLQVLSPAFFVNSQTASVMNQMNRQTDVMLQGFESINAASRDLFTIVALTLTAAGMSLKNTLIAAVVIPLGAYTVRVAMGRSRQASQKVQQHYTRINQMVLEAVQGLRVIRIFQAEETVIGKFDRAMTDASNAGLEVNMQVARVGVAYDLMNFIGGGIVFYVGGLDVLAGNWSVGALVGFLGAVAAIYAPINRFLSLYVRALQISGAGETLIETLELEPTVRDTGKRESDDLQEIEFKGVAFRFLGTERSKDIFSDVNISIRRGEVVAVMGPNGTGKSTLLNLIPRFYDVTAGSICFDGIDIRDLSIASLRNKISMVSQEIFLFSGTIWDNILIGNPRATDAEVRKAAELAGVSQFALTMPNQYQTLVGENGATLSGGQRQRIAIARAYLKDAPLLLLDEPTSSLDAASSDAIAATLKNLMANRIVLIVSHQETIFPVGTRIIRSDLGFQTGTGPVSAAALEPDRRTARSF